MDSSVVRETPCENGGFDVVSVPAHIARCLRSGLVRFLREKMSSRKTAVFFILLSLYTVVFLEKPFEPLAGFFGNAPSRISLFTFLNEPAFLWEYWCGESGRIFLFDRLVVFTYFSGGFFAAFAIGSFLFYPESFKAFVPPFSRELSGKDFRKNGGSFSEQFVFATAAGLGVFSLFELVLGLCGLAKGVVFIRAATFFLALSGIFILLRKGIPLSSRKVETVSEQQSKKNFSTISSDVKSRRRKRINHREGQSQPSSKAEKTAKNTGNAVFSRCFLLVPLAFLIPLISLYLLSFPLPPVEYDVISYHLPGVKEIFQSGHLGLRGDSVYMNMPLGAEMYSLWGMQLCNDWYLGALIGKTMIGATTFLTAFALFTFCGRFFSKEAGLLAAVVYLANPWIFLVSTTGLIDGVVSMYLFLAFYMLVLFWREFVSPLKSEHGGAASSKRFLILSGFFSGCAASCKYPAVLFVVVPIFTGLCVLLLHGTLRAGKKRKHDITPENEKPDSRRFSLFVPVMLFLLAVSVSSGLWYAKNFAFTGNPTYPLLHAVFGDKSGHWNEEKNDRWVRTHSPRDFSLESVFFSTEKFLLSSEYQSPILVPLGLLGVFLILPLKSTKKPEISTDPQSERIRFGKKILGSTILYVGFVLLFWWLLTHRLDRFWVPTLPLLSLLAAVGAGRLRNWGKSILLLFLGFSVLYAILLAAIPSPGKYNRFFLSMQAARTDPLRILPWNVYYNSEKPRGTLLLIGEARCFDYETPVLFSSCWNDSPLETIVLDENKRMRSTESIREELKKRNITDIFVNWNEISRFRSEGNYGFTKFIEPEIFEDLLRRGILHEHFPFGIEGGSGVQFFEVL